MTPLHGTGAPHVLAYRLSDPIVYHDVTLVARGLRAHRAEHPHPRLFLDARGQEQAVLVPFLRDLSRRLAEPHAGGVDRIAVITDRFGFTLPDDPYTPAASTVHLFAPEQVEMALAWLSIGADA